MTAIDNTDRHNPAAPGAGRRPGTPIVLGLGRSLTVVPCASDCVLEVTSGLAALDVELPTDRTRVFDFLLPGDILQTRPLAAFARVELRGIETTRLVRLSRADWIASTPPEQIAAAIERQEMRRLLQDAILGLSDVDGRVASFLMSMALRQTSNVAGHTGLDVGIPREDVADYIHINPDTLSRSFSRLRRLEAISRAPGHRLAIRNWANLTALTPLAPVIEAALTPRA